jgi:hypothetical protein
MLQAKYLKILHSYPSKGFLPRHRGGGKLTPHRLLGFPKK